MACGACLFASLALLLALGFALACFSPPHLIIPSIPPDSAASSFILLPTTLCHSAPAPHDPTLPAAPPLPSSSLTQTQQSISCPASCFRPNPVCGVDGVTYWCGSADANCAGVKVEYEGFCEFGSRGTGGRGVLAEQSLLLVHMIWLMLAAFLVLLGVP